MATAEGNRPRVKTVFDVEPTTRCNARCVMCPRDKVPELGSMDERTFRQVVARAVEYGEVDAMVLGGLGEPTVHKDLVRFVGIAADAGVRPSIITNGMLLTPKLSRDLVAAGIRSVDLSIGGYSKETYESVQVGCKFETVYRNGIEFARIAAGKAMLNIQVSPTEQTYREAEKIAAFWRANGAKFVFIFAFAMSRGGALDKGEQARGAPAERIANIPRGCANIEELFRPSRRDYRAMHDRADFVCYPKDRFCFISYRGTYQLCCNDYEKKHTIGDVFSMSVDEAFEAKAKLGPKNNALCSVCDMSNGDLAARDLKFYLRAGAYLLRSRAMRLTGRRDHSGLGGTVTTPSVGDEAEG